MTLDNVAPPPNPPKTLTTLRHVSHELSNILTVVMGNVDIIRGPDHGEEIKAKALLRLDSISDRLKDVITALSVMRKSSVADKKEDF